MHSEKLKLIGLFLLLPAMILLGDTPEQDRCCESNCDTTHSLHFCRGNSISIGPEIYRVSRTRAGGTRQKGNAAGIRITYDRIKRYHYYLGAQLFYGTGTLHGQSGFGEKIRSRLTDSLIEGNAGYTFQAKCLPHLSFTPFAGYGYFNEENKFVPPTNLRVKFTTQFHYISFGFLSSVYVLPCFTIGINGRFKWPLEAHCKVANDPDFNKVHQIVGDKLHYRIELPITYFGSLLWNSFEIAFVPFVDERLYGERENFPFDFFKTRLSIYGANLQFIYRF